MRTPFIYCRQGSFRAGATSNSCEGGGNNVQGEEERKTGAFLRLLPRRRPSAFRHARQKATPQRTHTPFQGCTDGRQNSSSTCIWGGLAHLDDVVQRVQVEGPNPRVRDLGGADEEAREQAEHGRQSPSEGLGHLGVRKNLCATTVANRKKGVRNNLEHLSFSSHVGRFQRSLGRGMLWGVSSLLRQKGRNTTYVFTGYNEEKAHRTSFGTG